MVQAFTTKNNDNMFGVYVATLIRSIVAYHNLINNVIQNKETVTQVKPKPVEAKK